LAILAAQTDLAARPEEAATSSGRQAGPELYYVARYLNPGQRPPLAPSPPNGKTGEDVVKLTLRERETAQEAVRRFRKLVERSGIKKEIRVREFYEKPSETKRRARLRAARRARRERLLGR